MLTVCTQLKSERESLGSRLSARWRHHVSHACILTPWSLWREGTTMVVPAAVLAVAAVGGSCGHIFEYKKMELTLEVEPLCSSVLLTKWKKPWPQLN